MPRAMASRSFLANHSSTWSSQEEAAGAVLRNREVVETEAWRKWSRAVVSSAHAPGRALHACA